MRSDAQPIRMRRCAAQPLTDLRTAHRAIRIPAQRYAARDTIKNHPLGDRSPAFEGRACAPLRKRAGPRSGLAGYWGRSRRSLFASPGRFVTAPPSLAIESAECRTFDLPVPARVAEHGGGCFQGKCNRPASVDWQAVQSCAYSRHQSWHRSRGGPGRLCRRPFTATSRGVVLNPFLQPVIFRTAPHDALEAA
jgi:hypothetical protein